MTRGEMFFVPLEDATAPATGECIAYNWWAVHPEKGVAFYRWGVRGSMVTPQCNYSRSVIEHWRIADGCEARLLPIVFLAHAERMAKHLGKIK